MSVMLYKCPGKELLHGIECEYTIVKEDDVENCLNNGWNKTPTEAEEVFLNESDNIYPTREELELKAFELGISFKHNIKDKTLLNKINSKLKEDEDGMD